MCTNVDFLIGIHFERYKCVLMIKNDVWNKRKTFASLHSLKETQKFEMTLSCQLN